MSYHTIADVCKNVCYLNDSFTNQEVDAFKIAFNNYESSSESDLLFGWKAEAFCVSGENELLCSLKFSSGDYIVNVMDVSHPCSTYREYVVFGETRDGVVQFLRDAGFSNVDAASIKNTAAVMWTY